jgi:hypothetical protein
MRINRPRSVCIRLCLVIFVCVLLGSAMNNAVVQTPEAKLKAKLQTRVKDFDNQGKALIPTLLKIASDYGLPMGIEKVVKQSVGEPITVRLASGTVATLLDIAVSQLSDYSWATDHGAVEVYGVEEFSNPSNLLNNMVPSFSVNNETLDDANMKLRNIFFVATQNPSGAYAGSYIGTPQLGDQRISLNVENATIRSILNRLAALHAEAVWIARVSPERLTQRPLPTAGLWRFLPKGIQDTQGILDLK